MPMEATAETDRAAEVRPRAPWRIQALNVLHGHRLAVTFQDGTQGVADLSSVVTAPECGIFSALKDSAHFAQARLDLGVVTWPNGADLDPDWMYDELRKAKKWSVPIQRLGEADLPEPRQRWAVKLDFLDANPNVVPQAAEPQTAVFSYFKGQAADWHTGLKTYRELRYPELWPGIDLVYSGTVNRLKYHFEIKPGADPDAIRLAYRGASSVELTDDGQLAVSTPVGGFQDAQPTAWQDIDGERIYIAVAYQLARAGDAGQPFGYRLGRYDRSEPMILDPVVTFIGRDTEAHAAGATRQSSLDNIPHRPKACRPAVCGQLPGKHICGHSR